MKNLNEITRRFVGLVALSVFLFTLVSADAAVKFATGLSGETNAPAAAAEAAAQMKAKLDGTVPDLIVICDNKQVADINPVLNAIAVEFPGVPVYGRGDYWDPYDPYSDDGVTGVVGDTVGGLGLLALCGVGYEAHYITGVDSTFSASAIRAKGQELANLIDPLPTDTKVVLVFGDMHGGNGINNFVPGMIDILGNNFPLVVGSQNDWTPYIYHNGSRVTDPAQAIILKGNFGVSFAVAQGSSPSYWAVEAAAAQSALDAVPAGMEPKLMLWFNCNSRRGTDLQAHIDAVQAVIGTDLPMFGAYSGGEAGKPGNTANIQYGTGLGIFALIYDIASPLITPPGGGIYVDPVPVTLSISNPGAGASIRYTTDGSDPDENSTLYTGQFSLTAGTTVKARTYVADGNCSDVSTAAFAINTALANEPPAVYAGGYQRIRLPDDTVQLDGIVSDETLPYPPGDVAKSWSVVSGPAAVVFEDANLPATNAVFSTAGQYLLRLTADDGELAVSDDVPVYVADAGSSQPVTALLNPSFELDQNGNPSTVKRDFDEVQGWVSGLDQGSGVETILHPTDPARDFTGTGDGLMKAFGKWVTDIGQGDWFYQIMSHQIVAGDQYHLTFAYGPSSADTSVIASFIDGSTMDELASVTVSSSVIRVFADYTLDFTVPEGANCVGHDLGIKFTIGQRPQPWDGWASVDNLRLEYVPGLPTVAGDLTGDSVVNEGDLKELVDMWLWSGSAGSIPEDMVVDQTVNAVDFAYLADQWLTGQ